MWQERLFRSEPESEPKKIGSKKGPESEILRNSPEFRSEFPTKISFVFPLNIFVEPWFHRWWGWRLHPPPLGLVRSLA